VETPEIDIFEMLDSCQRQDPRRPVHSKGVVRLVVSKRTDGELAG
jgi:hypothetical protein